MFSDCQEKSPVKGENILIKTYQIKWIFEVDCPSSPPLKGKMDTINVDKAVEFVLSCMNFDGGFGCRPGSESHAGQVSLLTSHMSG